MPFLLDGNDRLQSLSWTLTGNHWWQRGTLRCFRRVRLYGFLFGLMVTFLIMAVYILTGERKGLLLTPSPYHFGSLINSSPYNLSFSKDYSSIKQVVKSIVSKVEFSSRQVPDRKGLLYSEPQMFSIIPNKFLSKVKNPCWYEEYPGNGTEDPYGKNFDGFHDRYPVEDYLDLFDLAAYQIQEHLLRNETTRQKKHNIIIGEASASTMWDNNAWVYFYENSTNGEPPFMVQDFIHAVQPDAKFIVMLRDPVERLYSDYLYFGIANKSAEDFHERVSESLQLFEGCLSESSMRSCVYNTTLNNAMPVRLQVGLYIVYLLDWLTVFKMDQILILRLEDHAANRKYTMRKVFDFLKLGSLTEQKEAEITKSPASNTRRPADKSLGPMLPITKEILQEFYFPFNQRLTQVLKNDSFLWVTDTEDAHN
ncbi:hypothetical protein Z043_116486 [Scleropages formosus]|uniref:Sulfotransferase n=1 Tax=Scleropages formosus TaxID=113540 RepID=A0A0P7YF65_SCLFO|nr:hypothetical protein Z043_116486 [Scleropages formosus]